LLGQPFAFRRDFSFSPIVLSIITCVGILLPYLPMDANAVAGLFGFKLADYSGRIVHGVACMSTVEAEPVALAVFVLGTGLDTRESKPTMHFDINLVIVLAVQGMARWNSNVATTVCSLPIDNHSAGQARVLPLALDSIGINW
jgi:hypothetical protein